MQVTITFILNCFILVLLFTSALHRLFLDLAKPG